MIDYNELRPGQFIEYEGSVFQILEASFLRMQQRKPVMRVKMKDLISGKIKEVSFQQSDRLEEANLEKIKAVFIYENKGQYWFHEVGNPKNRFFFEADFLGASAQFLKPSLEVTVLKFKDKFVSVELPIKVDYKVKEAPPSVKGDTASGGSKQVILETGAKVTVPFFINQGDIIRINTQTGEYVERVEKG
ncbi:MAG: elongation factor P [Candidatus Parcubacteria bacterium]|nr:elongation factor P [Patescibacteria group bacterium]BCX15999.1 MAG: elongation factor P [Candidatus Parcubacteria bacterium]